MVANITKAMSTIITQIEVIKKLKNGKGDKIKPILANKIDTFDAAYSTIKIHVSPKVVRGVQAYDYVGNPEKLNLTIRINGGEYKFERMQEIVSFGDAIIKELKDIK